MRWLQNFERMHRVDSRYIFVFFSARNSKKSATASFSLFSLSTESEASLSNASRKCSSIRMKITPNCRGDPADIDCAKSEPSFLVERGGNRPFDCRIETVTLPHFILSHAPVVGYRTWRYSLTCLPSRQSGSSRASDDPHPRKTNANIESHNGERGSQWIMQNKGCGPYSKLGYGASEVSRTRHHINKVQGDSTATIFPPAVC